MLIRGGCLYVNVWFKVRVSICIVSGNENKCSRWWRTVPKLHLMQRLFFYCTFMQFRCSAGSQIPHWSSSMGQIFGRIRVWTCSQLKSWASIKWRGALFQISHTKGVLNRGRMLIRGRPIIQGNTVCFKHSKKFDVWNRNEMWNTDRNEQTLTNDDNQDNDYYQG